MSRDLLDDLIDRSAPPTRAAGRRELDAMATAARRDGTTRRRAPRVAVGVGLAALLLGGAGIAVASDGLSWAPWAQHPVGAVAFTMSNGFDCELRFSAYRDGPDPVFLADVNSTLERWYGSTDVVAEARARVHDKGVAYAALRSAEDEAEWERQLAELSPEDRAEAIAHQAWADEWTVWELVVGDLESEALTAAGFVVPDPRFVGSQRNAQIQCFELDGEPYVPGAGS